MANDRNRIRSRLRDNSFGRAAQIRRNIQGILQDALTAGQLKPGAKGFWETTVRHGEGGWDMLSAITEQDLQQAGELIKQGLQQADPNRILNVEVDYVRFHLSWWEAEDLGQNRWRVKYGRYIVAEVKCLQQQADGTLVRRKGTLHFNYLQNEETSVIINLGAIR